MFDPTPTELFAGMSEDGTNLTIPLASIPGLTAAEADAVTGDSRKIIYSFLERFANFIQDLPTADKPARLTGSRSRASETSEDGIYTRSFSFQCQIGGVDLDVANEPA